MNEIEIEIEVVTYIYDYSWEGNARPVLRRCDVENGMTHICLSIGDDDLLPSLYNGGGRECADAMRSYAALFTRMAEVLEAELLANASDGGWIMWSGGKCPVAGSQGVEVRLRKGIVKTYYARALNWDTDGGDHDIIAYRVVEDSK